MLGGRPVVFNARSRRRRSQEGYVGPNKLVETDMDYVGEKRKSVQTLMGGETIIQYYRYYGLKDSRKKEFQVEFQLDVEKEEEPDYHCYPSGGEALAQHDKLLYPRIKDSRIHRWIRLKKNTRTQMIQNILVLIVRLLLLRHCMK